MVEPIVVVSYDPRWPERFATLAAGLRGALGAVALRIDHIGSTAVPGLVAKPIVDVQISVADFEPLAAFRAQRYGALKLELAERRVHDRHAYTEAKRPFIWEAVAAADLWAQSTGWTPGPSDA